MMGIIATIATVGPLANGASRIVWGLFSDRVGRENTLVLAVILQAISLVAVAAVGRNSPTLFAIALVCVFFTWGELYSLFPSTLGDYFGSKHATSTYSFLYTAKGVAASLGAYLGTRLVERAGWSWESVFYGCAVLALTSAMVALVLRTRPLPHKAAEQKMA